MPSWYARRDPPSDIPMSRSRRLCAPFPNPPKERNVGWQKLADLGNRLRHAYHRVDPEVLEHAGTEGPAPATVLYVFGL